MREEFCFWRPFSDEQNGKLWKEALIVFDSSALIGILESEETAGQWFSILEKTREQLWIPYQVGLEYSYRLPSKLDPLAGYDSQTIVSNILSKLDCKTAFQSMPSPYKDKLKGAVKEAAKDAIKAAIEKELGPMQQESARRRSENDRKLCELCSGKIGEKELWTKAKDEAGKVGRKRYEQQIPPGYKDGQKNANQLGDLIIWFEVIRQAETEKRPIILVTADAKEDWIQGGKAHPRLLKEFWEKTDGQRVLIYSPSEFLGEAGRRLGVDIDKAKERAVCIDRERAHARARVLASRIQYSSGLPWLSGLEGLLVPPEATKKPGLPGYSYLARHLSQSPGAIADAYRDLSVQAQSARARGDVALAAHYDAAAEELMDLSGKLSPDELLEHFRWKR